MATPPDIGRLDLSNSDDDVPLASPSRASKPSQKVNTKPQEGNNGPAQRNSESKYDAEQAREANLQRELEGVRSINEVIEGVISSLECAKGNMDVSSRMHIYGRSSDIPRRFRARSLRHLHYSTHGLVYSLKRNIIND